MSKTINSISLTGKVIAFMVAIAFTLLAGTASAQTKPGNEKKDRDVFTNLYFTATNGAKWRIYLTPTGERYAVRYSKFTKKQYRYYLPKSYTL